MVEATPDGDRMLRDTYDKTLEFNASYDPSLIFLSGGEPTDHPTFLEYLWLAKRYKDTGKVLYVLVASNGMFLEDESYTKEIIKMGVPFQITHDPRFYPREIKKVDHPLFMYEDTLRIVSPMGRAVSNNLATSRQSPLCFNLRSLCNSYQDFGKAVSHLRGILKMCVPSINIDGSIVAGESPSCYKIGTVESTPEEIIQNMNDMKCGRCLLYKNLTGVHQDLWDEMEGR